VCLLIALFQQIADAPLIIAANRDERLDRPAVAMTVLRPSGPRILGGRDELAGGTWLAVNEYGVVAGLTNQPSADGRDAGKRSRGELPLAFAGHKTAAEAVAAVTARLNPAEYNPCWMLIGDRQALFSVGLAGGQAADVEELAPGLHILENAPLRAPSAKADFVRGLIGAERAAEPGPDSSAGAPGVVPLASTATVAALERVLSSNQPAVPEPRTDDQGRTWASGDLGAVRAHAGVRDQIGDDRGRPGERKAACARSRRPALRMPVPGCIGLVDGARIG